VRQSPLPEAHNAFVVHDGAEMNVLDEQPGWLQVSAGPRQIGWLPVDQVIQMRRP
jgi:hypothetical protein